MSIDSPAFEGLSRQESGRLAFTETSDPSAYVPRNDTESVLSSLEAWAAGDRSGTTVGALVGPPGLGKTILLRVFESRNVHNSLYLPYAGLAPTELIAWIYGLLGRSPRGGPEPSQATNPSGQQLDALLDLAATSGDPFFLLIDDADSMPAELLRAFVNELPLERSTLRILMALNEDAKASRLLAGFDSLHPSTVRLQSPMNESETAHYLAARMAWAGSPPTEISRVDSEMARRVFALSGGVPQTVHRIAHSLLSGDEVAIPGDLDAKQRREDWMGRPFEDDPFEVDS